VMAAAAAAVLRIDGTCALLWQAVAGQALLWLQCRCFFFWRGEGTRLAKRLQYCKGKVGLVGWYVAQANGKGGPWTVGVAAQLQYSMHPGWCSGCWRVQKIKK
jgi:hypothetical protein